MCLLKIRRAAVHQTGPATLPDARFDVFYGHVRAKTASQKKS